MACCVLDSCNYRSTGLPARAMILLAAREFGDLEIADAAKRALNEFTEPVEVHVVLGRLRPQTPYMAGVDGADSFRGRRVGLRRCECPCRTQDRGDDRPFDLMRCA